MLKALLHKQMAEIKGMYFRSKKTGTVATGKGGTGLKIVFIFLYMVMLGSFFAIAALFGSTLLKIDLAWVYFMVMTIMAFIVGIIGSVFTTAAALFQAKDNEFLLSLPIQPSKIILSRMVSVYMMSVIYESMVMIPAILYFFFFGHPSVLAVIFCILGLFLMGFMVTGFSCFFGWIIALIMSKLKNQKILTVIVSVIFIALFMYLRFKANDIFKNLAMNAENIGNSVKGWGYPLYALGLGMSGQVVGFLAFLGMTAVVFGVTYLIITKSFYKIVATKNETIKGEFKDSQIKTAKVKAALRRKEMKRFTASPAYMLNCGLGLLFLIAGAVIAIIKAKDITYFITNITAVNAITGQAFPVFFAAGIWILASFCDITAPAISLEGSSIWQIQVMPVDPFDVLMAKLYVHVVLVSVPTLICSVVVGIVLHLDAFTFIMVILSSLAFVVFSGSAMLAIDLKKPMLVWNNESQPVKQNANVVISMFGGMILAAILGGLYFLVGAIIGSAIYLVICFVLFAVFTVIIINWFKKKGRTIFATL